MGRKSRSLGDWLLLGLALSCAAGSLLSVVVLLSSPEAELRDFRVSPGEEQSFGKVRQKSSTDVVFSLTNTTSKPLRILDVATTCGCTSTNMPKRLLLSGESTNLTLTFNSGQYRGAVRAVADIAYSDTTENGIIKSLQLSASGAIDPDYNIRPELVKFKAGVAESRRIVVAPNFLDELAVDRVVCDKRFFSARLLRQTPTQVEIDLSFDPDEFYPDAGPAQLEIHTNSVIQPIAFIPIEVN